MERFRLSGGSDDERWFQVGGIDVNTSLLVAALCTISMFAYAVDKTLLYWLALVSDRTIFVDAIVPGVRQGQIWRVATWPMLNPPKIMVLLSVLIIWWFGRELERVLGRVRYLWFLAIVVVLPAVLYVGVVPTLIEPTVAIAGASYLSSAIVMAFVVAYLTTRSFFNVPFWIVAVVFEGLTVLEMIGDRMWDGLFFLVTIVAVALVCARSFGLTTFEQIPKVPLPGFITKDPYQKANRAREKAQRLQRRRGENVVPMAPRQTKHLDAHSQADMDRLLDKIADSGIGSLTPDERQRLDELSRRLREQ